MSILSWWNRFASWFSAQTPVESVDPNEVYSLCLRDPNRARGILAAEQRSLAEELEKTFLAYEERLETLAQSLHSMDGRTLSREVGVIRETQEKLRQAIVRAALTDQETRALLDEWRDWERMEKVAKREDPAAMTRREMLRSELALRGVSLDPFERQRRFEADVPAALSVIPTQERRVPDAVEMIAEMQKDDREERREATDTLPEWDEIVAPRIPQAAAFWEKQLRGLTASDGEISNERAGEIVHLFREAHEAQKRMDRQNGVKRDRVTAFQG